MLWALSLLLVLASREQRQLQRWTRVPVRLRVGSTARTFGPQLPVHWGVVSAWDQVRQVGRGNGGFLGLKHAPRLEEQRKLATSRPLCPGVLFPFVIFTVYAMLPLDMRDAITAGVTPHSCTYWSEGCIFGLSPTSGRRCCHR